MPALPSNSLRPRAWTVPVAIYSRVSTANQGGDRFDSGENQAAGCRDYSAKHASDGWFEIARFSDPACSGGSMNRPGVRALLRQIAAGEIKIVLIFKLERVLRSTDAWGPFRSLPRQHGSRLVSPTQDISDVQGLWFCPHFLRGRRRPAAGRERRRSWICGREKRGA